MDHVHSYLFPLIYVKHFDTVQIFTSPVLKIDTMSLFVIRTKGVPIVLHPSRTVPPQYLLYVSAPGSFIYFYHVKSPRIHL